MLVSLYKVEWSYCYWIWNIHEATICTKSNGTQILNFEKSVFEEVCNELEKIDGDATIVPKNMLWENGGNVLGADKKDAIYILSNKV